MIDFSWTIESEPDAEFDDVPRPLLSTWHYLRGALRRSRRTWVGLAVLGVLLGLGSVLVMPPGSAATVTVLMAHPSNIDGPEGSTMDASLLSTREVSLRTVHKLGLHMTPEAFRSTMTIVPVTTQVLTISIAAPDDAAAISRLSELVRQYLDFRATELRSMSGGLVSGYNSRISSLKQQIDTLTAQYDSLSEQGASGQGQAFEVLARRTELATQVTNMQQAIDATTLQTDAAVSSTHVIDPPHLDSPSTKRAAAIAMGSGLIGGAALGIGLVLFRALVTDRLRRRQDVSIALGAPVRVTVRSKGPRGSRRGLQRLLPGRRRWRGRDLDLLAHGIERAIGPVGGRAGAARGGRTQPVSAGARGVDRNRGDLPGRSATVAAAKDRSGFAEATGPMTGVALAAIGNARAAADVIGSAATRLRARGLSVLVVDLSANGVLAARPSRDGEPKDDDRAADRSVSDHPDGRKHRPAPLGVLRPGDAPQAARGPRGPRAAGRVDGLTDEWQAAWDASDVVLVLLEVDAGIDLDHLCTWVPQVVPLVTAGQPTAELLDTTRGLIDAAGLRLPFAMMIAADVSDESLGVEGPTAPGEGR